MTHCRVVDSIKDPLHIIPFLHPCGEANLIRVNESKYMLYQPRGKDLCKDFEINVQQRYRLVTSMWACMFSGSGRPSLRELLAATNREASSSGKV